MKTRVSDSIALWTLFGVTLVFLLFLLWAFTETMRYKYFSAEAEATVTKIEVNDNDTYRLDYSYFNIYENTVYSNSRVIRENVYRRIKDEGKIAVNYVRSRPNRIVIRNTSDENSILLISLGLVAALLAFYRTLLAVRKKITVNQLIGVNSGS